MVQELRQSTEVKVKIHGVVAVADGFTPVTNLDVSTADEAELFKHDAAAVTDISGGTFAAIANADGSYNLTMTTGYTDTLGLLDVIINDDSLCLPIWARYMVVTQQYWDSKYSTDKLQVDAVEISSDATAADDLELFIETAKGTDHKVLISADAQDLSATLDVNTKTLETGLDFTAAMQEGIDKRQGRAY